MEFNSTALAALPLSASRRLKREVLEHFSTMQLPLPDLLVKKNMPATTVVWAQAIQTEEEKIPIIGEIRTFLYAQETDELLGRATHLAPVFAAAQTEDAEASSVLGSLIKSGCTLLRRCRLCNGSGKKAACRKHPPIFRGQWCGVLTELHVRIDTDVLEWFKAHGTGY